MNFKKMGINFLTLAFVGLFIAGCNENDPTPPGGDDMTPPTNLMASSGNTEVRLSWTASTTTGAVYEVAVDDVVVASDLTGTAYTATGLTNGTVYEFTVTAVNPDDDEDVASASALSWAPADRYAADGDQPAQQIRIYEKESAKGSGLAIDTRNPFNGPSNVSLAASSTDLARAQLALFVESDDQTFRFGPAWGFSVSDYANRAQFDQTTVISDDFFLVDVNTADPIKSFDNWFLDEELSTFFAANRTTAYGNLTDRTDTKGYGFIIRTGNSAANYHYARVIVVPNTNGEILQGSGDEQYVTLVVSYQNAVNVPYAKK